ncbi:hypothetical protein [Paracoccus jeotgali]|uniref:Arginine transporter n=1 Tax=Paracoccus jeotgali TaxID=2065379 RepID=A0A2K9MG68_9RHOB|nr:hypothetical protein [Paracoccus jeotgali]AUM73505.1 hypothetical protein CYR75_03655 [Paracoccus jeotgali]
MNRILIAAAAIILTTPLAMAGPIDSACIRSDRGARQPNLCQCAQQVANQTLSRADQRLAASFFRDPHRAQVVRMSKRDADNAFWARYKAFAGAAEAYCR